MSNDIRSSPKTVTALRGLNPRMLHSDELLARVTMPAVFLWGDEDPNGGETVARSFVGRMPDARLEMIPRAGHAPWIDELDLCAERTAEFLASRAGG